MTDIDPEFAKRINDIVEMVTGLSSSEAARTLASAVVTVARDRCGDKGEEFASNVVEMIDEGMHGEGVIVVHKSEVTQ